MTSPIGPIALFGSGETSPTAQKIHHRVMSLLAPPVRAAIVETPAGFELNSEMVAQKVADYLIHRLQNFAPRTELAPARKRGTPFSPDDPACAEPIFRANYLFMGPGSPTYAVRQLRDSFTWHSLLAQHRLGAALCLSSAATIAVSKHAMPVYEIYKVGEDLHWKAGLDFFAQFGLDLTITPHWNNNDGGEELDTSRCYMGQARYARLLEMLPEPGTILGIEENTGVVIDPNTGLCDVVGAGSAIVLRDGQQIEHAAGAAFPLDLLGEWRLPQGNEGIPADVWAHAVAAANAAKAERAAAAPEHIAQLVQEREDARAGQDWESADRLRDELLDLGWQVLDTPDGPQLEKMENA